MSNINIKQIIAHDIDTDNDHPRLFDQIFNLTSVPNRILTFFKDHINVSLNAKQIKTSQFNSNSIVNLKTSEIAQDLSNTEVFIQKSKELTQSLHDAIISSTSKSSGTIFFIVYDINEVNHLAILKMDPNSGIQIDKTSLKLTVQENMLPNPGDKLHKCAFIKLETNINDRSNIYVLDRQRGPTGVSMFFMKSFLNAEEVVNDKIMTDRVIDKLYEEAPNIAPDKDPIEFHLEVDNTFSNGRHIDLDNVLDELIRPHMENEKAREEYIEGFKSSFSEEYEDYHYIFTVNKENTKVVYYTEEKDIKFEFPIRFLNDIVTIDDSNEDSVHVTINKDMYIKYK
ncbi:nucleoid-associated protein [Alkalibacillus salilacus]|uniref:Nucleoid-associated protein n=1 Tax=Alkalibacillus salilacus TaxID=284582 RepID=A0ABT9VD12_9BACI|nr:nucleoid-associated protein [Alkalibacillus salilacus]MDQ0158856.1 hypothetical protein [Alkalibacillus salilacus]